MNSSRYVYDQYGVIVDILSNSKAVIEFKNSSTHSTERALMFVNKLFINGEGLDEGETISKYVKKGDKMKFNAHQYDKAGKDRCNWFVAEAEIEKGPKNPKTHIITNMIGQISDLENKRGWIKYKGYLVHESVIFYTDKLWVNGKKVGEVKDLRNILSLGETLHFNAESCDSDSSNNYSPWYATQVWKGQTPREQSVDTGNRGDVPKPMATRNTAVSYKGEIGDIFNEGTGALFWKVTGNFYNSVVFSRDVCFLYGLHLHDKDLRDIFKEGE